MQTDPITLALYAEPDPTFLVLAINPDTTLLGSSAQQDEIVLGPATQQDPIQWGPASKRTQLCWASLPTGLNRVGQVYFIQNPDLQLVARSNCIGSFRGASWVWLRKPDLTSLILVVHPDPILFGSAAQQDPIALGSAAQQNSIVVGPVVQQDLIQFVPAPSRTQLCRALLPAKLNRVGRVCFIQNPALQLARSKSVNPSGQPEIRETQ